MIRDGNMLDIGVLSELNDQRYRPGWSSPPLLKMNLEENVSSLSAMQIVSDNKASDTKKDIVCKKPHMLHPSTYKQRRVEQNVQQYQNLRGNSSHTAPHFLQWKILSSSLRDHPVETSTALCLCEVRVLDCWMDWWAFVPCETLWNLSWGVMQRCRLPKRSTFKWNAALYCPKSRKEAGTLL